MDIPALVLESKTAYQTLLCSRASSSIYITDLKNEKKQQQKNKYYIVTLNLLCFRL